MFSRKLRVGIIGAGSRGSESFGRLLSRRDDVAIAALCDSNPVRLKAAAGELGVAGRLYASDAEMLAAGDDLDGVVITTPDHCHAEHAIRAIGHGVNVLIDKPLATTAADCQRVIAAAGRAGRFAMIGFNLRHDPTLIRLKQIIDQGALGRVFLIENREFYDGGRTYMARWNRRFELSGGLWVHKGSHDFDVFQWLLGFPRPTRVSAVAGVSALAAEKIPFQVDPGRPVGPSCTECAYDRLCPDVCKAGGPMWGEAARKADGYARDACIYTSDKDVHDNGIAIVEYDSGARASHLECFVTSVTDRLYTVVGDRGQAEASLGQRRITVRPRWSRDAITYDIGKVEGGHGGADPGLVQCFVRALRGEVEVGSTLEHGLWSTAVGQAAEISWREGRAVRIAEVLAAPAGQPEQL